MRDLSEIVEFIRNTQAKDKLSNKEKDKFLEKEIITIKRYRRFIRLFILFAAVLTLSLIVSVSFKVITPVLFASLLVIEYAVGFIAIILFWDYYELTEYVEIGIAIKKIAEFRKSITDTFLSEIQINQMEDYIDLIDLNADVDPFKKFSLLEDERFILKELFNNIRIIQRALFITDKKTFDKLYPHLIGLSEALERPSLSEVIEKYRFFANYKFSTELIALEKTINKDKRKQRNLYLDFIEKHPTTTLLLSGLINAIILVLGIVYLKTIVAP